MLKSLGPFHKTRGKTTSRSCLILLLAICSSGASTAADFPKKPVTFVIPYTAGTIGDLWVRKIAPNLSARWKQPVIVENKPGGGTMVALSHVARSNPDGHTLLIGSLSTSMAKLTTASISFDPQVELVPVIKSLDLKILFTTNKETYEKAKSLPELVSLSKKMKDGIFYGGTGPGTAYNMSSGFVLDGLGMKYSDINYNGTQPFTIALIRNDVQIAINTPAQLKTHIDNGSLKPLAALSESRYSDFPDVPTVREAGYQGFLPAVWSGVFAPKGISKEVLNKISRDILEVTTAPDLKDQIEKSFSGTVPDSSPEKFSKDLEKETKMWREYLAKINFKPQ